MPNKPAVAWAGAGMMSHRAYTRRHGGTALGHGTQPRCVPSHGTRPCLTVAPVRSSVSERQSH